jgi:hypothetical protein
MLLFGGDTCQTEIEAALLKALLTKFGSAVRRLQKRHSADTSSTTALKGFKLSILQAISRVGGA